MPQLKRANVRPLLNTVGGRSAPASLQRPPPDVPLDAEPLDSDESQSLPDEERYAGPDVQRVSYGENSLAEGSSRETSPSTTGLAKASITSSKQWTRGEGIGTVNPNSVGSSAGSSRSSQKRKRVEVHSSSTTLVEPDEKGNSSDEKPCSQTNPRQRRHYGQKRKTYGATSNLHTKPMQTTEVAKANKSAFKQPEPPVQSSSDSCTRGFHAPTPLKEAPSRSSGRTAFEAPHSSPSPRASSKTTAFKVHTAQDTLGASGPTRTHLLPPLDTFESTQNNHCPEVATLESPSSPSTSVDFSQAETEVTLCPMCKAEVDAAFLKAFSGDKELHLKGAMDFCVAHKQRSAQSQWRTSKYPKIDWHLFGRRLRRLNVHVSAILEQRVESPYRRELEQKVALGQSRNALRNAKGDDVDRLKGLTGYYGAKGSQRMMEHIMTHFAGKIRSLAAKQRVFTEVGVSGFVQAVLVPELVLALVMEDFAGCDRDQASQIVAESAEVGDLVNEEEEENVETAHNENGGGRDDEVNGAVGVKTQNKGTRTTRSTHVRPSTTQ